MNNFVFFSPLLFCIFFSFPSSHTITNSKNFYQPIHIRNTIILKKNKKPHNLNNWRKRSLWLFKFLQLSLEMLPNETTLHKKSMLRVINCISAHLDFILASPNCSLTVFNLIQVVTTGSQDPSCCTKQHRTYHDWHASQSFPANLRQNPSPSHSSTHAFSVLQKKKLEKYIALLYFLSFRL